jgi:UDP-N-acetylglucosamine diphosphorylase/glucosamine-1-phosphate N-acetyltransferase
MSATLYLFDDEVARAWDPFLLTRPAGELLFGALLLRERAEAFLRMPCAGHFSREALQGFSEPGAPPVLDPAGISSSGTRVLLSSRAVFRGLETPKIQGAVTLRVGGEVVGWALPPDVPIPDSPGLLRPQPLPGSVDLSLDGKLLRAPWELMRDNGDQLREDLLVLYPMPRPGPIEGVSLIGSGIISVGDDVLIEPGVVLDLRDGPIRLSDGVEIRAHTRLAGPAFVGPGSSLLGGVISEVSIGPVCKIRGEVESCVILGLSNKAHDGFLGHSYLGRWVNLGAFTSNSDLKNNYGPVRIGSPRGPVDTGVLKAGCFVGDHVKTGIGTLLNTGTVVGAGSNLFGGKMPPTYVPPFSWGSGDELGEYDIERFLETGARVMARREMEMDDDARAFLRRAWEDSRIQRHGPE